MNEKVHARVLGALSNGTSRNVWEVLLATSCTRHDIETLKDAGLMRFTDTAGKTVRITPNGLAKLAREEKEKSNSH